MSEQKTEKGGISVQTEHIFPIIKKWLYSEKEIFLREIVSNACDAVTKLKRLESLGQVSDIGSDFRITVRADKEARTITVSDNGIGMTEEELKKYICQIALSGALDFIQKYEGESRSLCPALWTSSKNMRVSRRMRRRTGLSVTSDSAFILPLWSATAWMSSRAPTPVRPA